MSDTRWVQHKSGMGEKWKVDRDEFSFTWLCWGTADDKGPYTCHLPKSEYVPCPPPERWVDVTEECEWNERKYMFIHNGRECGTAYHIRKVKVKRGYVPEEGCVCNGEWAFIVEKKEG